MSHEIYIGNPRKASISTFSFLSLYETEEGRVRLAGG
jgi:hypothetical protein